MTNQEAINNRKRIKLRRRIFEFREKYLALAKLDRFKYDYIKTAEQGMRKRYLGSETQKRNHDKQRYIYYVLSDLYWIELLLNEHRKIKRAIKNFNGVLTQECWLPPILENVSYTVANKYKAYSVKSGIKYRELSNQHKKEFALLTRKKFKLKRRTGMQYRLTIISNTGQRNIISFPDWAICICETTDKPTMHDRDLKNIPIERSRIKVTPMS